MLGTCVAIKSLSISRTRDKLGCLQLLARKGIRLPLTLAAHSPVSTELLRESGMYPKIVRAVNGPGSPSRVRVASRSAAKSVVEGFRDLGSDILLQEILNEQDSVGIRCLAVGRKVLAAVKHGKPIGVLRTGVGRGASSIEISPEERALAVRAARVLGLGVAGVDLLRSNRGPFLLDVHCSPELRRVEAATGMDLAGRIIDFVVKATRS
jgi:ribosomal protein S6--L-glutamate ligase